MWERCVQNIADSSYTKSCFVSSTSTTLTSRSYIEQLIKILLQSADVFITTELSCITNNVHLFWVFKYKTFVVNNGDNF